MKIKLNRLILENFKGIRTFDFAPNGKSCTVKGENGAGKTSLQDAFTWGLFGKDASGKADFAIKALTPDGQEIHNINHSVTAVLTIDDKPISLRKKYAEKWVKKRGSAAPEFSGHTTDHFIDDVPVQQKEWNSRMGGMIDEEIFKLVTSPTYFNSLPWQKRREILIKICGDISDSDIIASNPTLASLSEILGNRSLDDQRKIATGQKREINKQLTEIPARIDELYRSMTDVSGYDKTAITAEVTELEARLRAITDDTAASRLRQQRAESEAEIAELKTRLYTDKQAAIKTVEDKIRALKVEIAISDDFISKSEYERTYLTSELGKLENKILGLKNEFSAVSNQIFVGDNVCLACGQYLPEDQIKAAIEKHNSQKAKILTSINEQGKLAQSKTDEHRKHLQELATKQAEHTECMQANSAKLELANAELAEINANLGRDTLRKIEAIERHLADISKMVNDRSTSQLPLLSELKEGLASANAKLAEIEAAKKTEARISELRAQEKRLTTEYEELERQLYLMDQFVISKVALLESKINSKFKLARFKLFENQINGGINETCVTLYQGVPWGSGLNTGAEMNVGLDIIRTLQAHYGIQAPVWIDHAESVTEILNVDAQMIKLIVDKNHKKLEVCYE